MFHCIGLPNKCVGKFICSKAEKKTWLKKKTTPPYGLSSNTWKSFLWLLDIQFIYLLSFITKYFIVKLKNLCPTSQILFFFNFFFTLWHEIRYSWGNSHFLLHIGKLFSWSFLVRSCLPVARSPCRAVQLLPSGEKEGKSELLGSAMTVLLAQWFGSMTRISAGSPCSCFGRGQRC